MQAVRTAPATECSAYSRTQTHISTGLIITQSSTQAANPGLSPSLQSLPEVGRFPQGRPAIKPGTQMPGRCGTQVSKHTRHCVRTIKDASASRQLREFADRADFSGNVSLRRNNSCERHRQTCFFSRIQTSHCGCTQPNCGNPQAPGLV